MMNEIDTNIKHNFNTLHTPLVEKHDFNDSNLPFIMFEVNAESTFKQLLPHWHKEFEINFILGGSATYFINSESKTVNEGEIILINCNSVHSGDYSDPKLSSITLLFDLSMFQTPLLDNSDVNFIKPLIENTANIQNVVTKDFVKQHHIDKLLLDITYIYTNKPLAYELKLKAKFFELLGLLYEINIINNSQINYTYNKHLDDIKTVLTYIDLNYAEKLYIKELADLISYNKDYFTKIFKHYVGVSCFSYITNLRVKKSEYLLKNTNLSITEIANKVGYESQSYYIQKFKEVHNISPKKYRADF